MTIAETSAPSGPTTKGGGEPKQRPTLLYVGAWMTVVILAVVVAFGGLPPLTMGVLTLVLLLALLFTGIPVGISMIIASTVCLTALRDLNLAAVYLRATLYDSVGSWQYSVIPLFLLMGIALWASGITTAAYDAARQWVGRLPGGLAMATTFAGAGLSASSGSTMATVLGLGRASLPEMFKSGYSPALATGSVAMAGTLGQIIPPSILLVIYSGVASTPVGPQLLAGLVPGLILAVGFAGVALAWAIIVPASTTRPTEGYTWRSRFVSLIGLIPIAIVMVIVMGGLAAGVFTATESAAIGAIAALVCGIAARGRAHLTPSGVWSFLATTLRETATAVAPLFLMLIGAVMMTTAIARTGLAQSISEWLVSLDLGRIALLMVLIVFYLVLGMFLESLPMILLTVPILQQPLELGGIDMIWFGVFIIIMCEIGAVFPPIGLVTFIVHRIAQDPKVSLGTEVRLQAVFRGVLPFIAVAIALLMLFVVVPDIVLWLPNNSAGE